MGRIPLQASETHLSQTDYRTKASFSEKEIFHILSKLQAKRADFLTVMLTGSLHQRRGFMATPPDTQDDGPRDDDVTKSESDSMDQSQDGPPSTLLADDHQKGPRDPGSLADVDPDQEDISKTLVLFSPGDVRKSPNSGDMGDGPSKELPLNEKAAADLQPCVLEKSQAEQEPTKKQCDADDGLLSSLQQEGNAPVLPASVASPLLIKDQTEELNKNQCKAEAVVSSLVRQKSNPQFTSVFSVYPPLTTVEKNIQEQESSASEKKANDGTFSLFKQECNQEVANVSSASSPFTKVKKTQPLQNKHTAQDLGISRLVKEKCNAPTGASIQTGSAASPPFTKVEQTFIHIAEITHFNIMCSKCLPVQKDNPEKSECLQFEREPRSNKTKTMTSLKTESIQPEIITRIQREEMQDPTLRFTPMSQVCAKTDIVSPFSVEAKQSSQRELPYNEGLPEKPKAELEQRKAEDNIDRKTTKPSPLSCLKNRSRIPILVSEDNAGVNESQITHEQIWKRSKQQDLARLVLEKQRLTRSTRLSSRTSSSLSSGDEPRRNSEAPSTTASEEDTHQLDDSFNKLKKEVKEQDGWRSRIPRPATPIRRPSAKQLDTTTSMLTLPGKSTMKEDRTQASSNRLKKPQSGTGTRSKSVLTRSGSPRMPLRCIFTTSRSLSSTHRTDSPSPPRPVGRTTINSQTRTKTLGGNRTKAAASVKNTAKNKKEQSTAAAR